jgi:NAD(P)-dependent dehydrogenase (short-subunit alcohol dehydrogenase family)
MQLQDHTAIITGASSGLGQTTALVLARAGANIVMSARRPEKLSAAAEAVRKTEAKVLTLPTDVGRPDQVERLVQTTLETFGRVDILVNSAALDYPAPITELTVEQWNEIIAVNLSGVFYACKAVFPIMMKQGGGYIFNISSVAGKRGWPNATAYCASKFALTGFTQALMGEGRPHKIRCSVIYPGGMDTGWHKERNPDFLNPEDVGTFLLHLITQDARFVVNEAVVTPLNEAGYP